MRRIRVLVVDDSVVVRRLVAESLAVDPAIEVVGVAASGRIALSRMASLRPDAVTLDVEMPELDGVETARRLRAAHPDLTIVMFAAPSPRTAVATLEALHAGADDYVAKPSTPGTAAGQQVVLAELVPRIKALAARRGVRPERVRPPVRRPAAGGAGNLPGGVGPALAALLAATGVGADDVPVPVLDKPARTAPYSVLLIGSSTGGPDALAKVVPWLAADLPVPVVVVQHMPPLFTAQLAKRLATLTPLEVREAVDGEAAVPGTILLAPGGSHLELHGGPGRLTCRLTDGPQENFCRPAVDVLFRTGVAACRGEILAAVLTGMGRDGQSGARLIQAAGGTVYAQDQATSVVWGMPGSVVTAGLADRVLPITDVGAALSGELLRVRPR